MILGKAEGLRRGTKAPAAGHSAAGALHVLIYLMGSPAAFLASISRRASL